MKAVVWSWQAARLGGGAADKTLATPGGKGCVPLQGSRAGPGESREGARARVGGFGQWSGRESDWGRKPRAGAVQGPQTPVRAGGAGAAVSHA